MFFKFVRHDLLHGLLGNKKHLVLTFIVFFFLASYHFLTLRIFSLTRPEYLQVPATTADYLLSVIGGCGKAEFYNGSPSSFSLPTMWMFYVLWMFFAVLYYPFNDLHGIGKQIMSLAGSRRVWWASKCVWAAATIAAHLVLVMAACALSGLCFGARLSTKANYYLAAELDMDMSELTTATVWDLLPVLGLVALALMALALLQLALSAVMKPLFSYLLLAAYLFAGLYIQSPLLLGNYLMPARSRLLITTGLSPQAGAAAFCVIAVVSTVLGGAFFVRTDILGGTAQE